MQNWCDVTYLPLFAKHSCSIVLDKLKVFHWAVVMLFSSCFCSVVRYVKACVCFSALQLTPVFTICDSLSGSRAEGNTLSDVVNKMFHGCTTVQVHPMFQIDLHGSTVESPTGAVHSLTLSKSLGI